MPRNISRDLGEVMMRMQVSETEEYDRRLRLVLLIYEVLKNMETPSEGATDEEILSLLSRACLDEVTVSAKIAAPPPRGEAVDGQRKPALALTLAEPAHAHRRQK
jgi:hypothetical protein